MNLQLSLKKNWFEMTKSGEKTEDYRDITPYWCNRLLTYFGNSQPKKFGENQIERNNPDWNLEKIVLMNSKKFKTNTMTLGYPKSTDKERILKLEHKGIEIRTGNPKWGAEPNKLYFVIKHGKIID